jgi:macrolide-specific efflux system membrane fusion protein
MKKNKFKIILSTIIFLLIVVFLFFYLKKVNQQNSIIKTQTVKPVIGDIVLTVITTGVVEPQNRLEIKPSISGRIEEILVHEGDHVRSGDILAWMSSIERAALMDAARSRGDKELKYWEEVYKKTPLISPIDGEIIDRPVEPGQTVTTSDAVLVLSDRLVVNAQFDETDIGRVKIGQKALIILDAYPDIQLDGVVDHIAYESQVISNVTIYDVDILLHKIPEILRSGMSTSVEVIEKTTKDVIIVPSSVIHRDGKRQFVLVHDVQGKILEREVTVGLNNDKDAEIISGLTTEDVVIVQDKTYMPQKRNSGASPFMPFGR